MNCSRMDYCPSRLMSFCPFRYGGSDYEPPKIDCPFYEKATSETFTNRTVYTENVTDGKFLQLQALVHDLRDKLGTLTDKKTSLIRRRHEDKF